MSSNGIDFVIGGKDKASPAMSAVENSMKRVEATTVKLKSATLDLSAAMAPLLAVYAAVKGVMAISGVVESANKALDEQSESMKRLSNALKIRGAEAMTASMVSVSREMEKVTGTSENVVRGLMSQASGMGFAADRMDDAAKAAIGLAQATGKDAAASMGDLKSALEGNFEAFYQLNPQIMHMRSNQEKMAAVLAIANQGLKEQSEDMTTIVGSGRRADSAITSLMTSVGNLLAPIRILINAGIQQFATSLDKLLVPAVEYANSILANIGPVMDWVKQKVVDGINIMIGAWTFLEVVLTNLDSVWEMVAAVAELAMIKISATISHALTEVIPAYAKWFGENFFNLMRDAVKGAYTVVKNYVMKIVDTFKAMWDYILSGGQTDVRREIGKIAGRSFLEGFQSSLTGLPEIAGRTITEREKDLADKIGAIGGRLGDEFSEKMKDRMISVGETLQSELQNVASLDLRARNAVVMQGVNVQEGRLLTRGSSSTAMNVPQLLQQIIGQVGQLLKKPGIENDDERTVAAIKANAQNKVMLVPTR
ncbi:MAG: hypothetical protein JNL58_31450 [Planctomyces sp.]|nr:hypothetical protein [Planctomyces sp.]